MSFLLFKFIFLFFLQTNANLILFLNVSGLGFLEFRSHKELLQQLYCNYEQQQSIASSNTIVSNISFSP